MGPAKRSRTSFRKIKFERLCSPRTYKYVIETRSNKIE